jgi:sulfhydrogenase subunit beta (sulfur reductase)
MTPRVSAAVSIRKEALQRIFDNLQTSGFDLVGPTMRDGAIVLDTIESITELPVGWTDDQKPSSYRLRRSGTGMYFDYSVGPQSWKKFLHPARLTILSTTRDEHGFAVDPPERPSRPFAFVGVRSCDIAAIAAHDRVFAGGTFTDPNYVARRSGIFVLAANCSKASPACFCTSMGGSPQCSGGYDLALTELPDGFVLDVGSEAGSEALRGTEWRPATAFELGRARQVHDSARRQIRRELRTDGLPELLLENLDSNVWRDAAQRCLTCGNCTMTCPTCFCTTVEDTSELAAIRSDRVRVWDSCFTSEFSHVHGGNLRPTTRSRYRQFVTHKFAWWKGQYGSFGCVGCGRCLTWCPAGIDVVAELETIRKEAQ